MQKVAKKTNVIFFVLDSLRARNLSCYGYYRKTSPNMDVLAKKGVLFENAFSTHNVTPKSILSILGGRHLSGKKPDIFYTKEEMTSFFNSGGIFLQEILKNNGYKTYCLKKLSGWQKKGFDYYFEKDSQEKSKKWNLMSFIRRIPLINNLPKFILHYSSLIPKKLEAKIRFNNSGKIVTDEAIKIIKENKRNSFFMWIDYMDIHTPYVFPPEFVDSFSSKEKNNKFFQILKSNKDYNKERTDFFKWNFKYKDTVEDIIAKYDTSILYVDSLIRKIVNTLKKERLIKNTIIFILSDHGESFIEHGIYFSHKGLYDVSFNVPLIISGENIPRDKKIKDLVQLEDITPTVLSLLKINYNPLLFDGKSLLPFMLGKKEKIRDQIFIEEALDGLKRRGIRTEKYKYAESLEKDYSICNVCKTSHGGIISLYDLEKDPEENINIAKQNEKIIIEMKLRLNKLIKDSRTMNEKRKIKNILSTLK